MKDLGEQAWLVIARDRQAALLADAARFRLVKAARRSRRAGFYRTGVIRRRRTWQGLVADVT